jgi:hypothetical protein
VRLRRAAVLLIAVTLLVVGLAAPGPAAADHGVDAQAPDLGMAPLTDFSVQKRPKGQRWLRFSAVIVNVGPGPFQAYGHADAGGELSVDQQFRTTSGTIANHATDATMYWSGDGHNHWHVRDLEQYVLEGQNGKTRLYGEKHGFCFWDNYRYDTTLPDYPSDAFYTGSNSCRTLTDGTVLMGLSIGWGDRYPATIVDQYINISGLPAGEYTVTATADWANWFAESDENNNSTTARIRISKNGVTVLDPGSGP